MRLDSPLKRGTAVFDTCSLAPHLARKFAAWFLHGPVVSSCMPDAFKALSSHLWMEEVVISTSLKANAPSDYMKCALMYRTITKR